MASFDRRGRVVVYAVAMQMLGLAIGPSLAASVIEEGYLRERQPARRRAVHRQRHLDPAAGARRRRGVCARLQAAESWSGGRLSDKVAIVTGGGQGIGRGISQRSLRPRRARDDRDAHREHGRTALDEITRQRQAAPRSASRDVGKLAGSQRVVAETLCGVRSRRHPRAQRGLVSRRSGRGLLARPISRPCSPST